ncbi:MAG: ParB/RepB/Spo0J family partition protein [Actinomycetia bacterium]|nr:ParB/RepB/Spo0J family partition protein [Actinomycetes bacterium]
MQRISEAPALGNVDNGTGDAPPQPASELAPVRDIPLDAILIREGFNARRGLADDADSLDDLKSSLREHGLVEPIVVRPREDGRFELVAGERRLRAARSLGWSTILAYVRPMDDAQAATVMLIENLQREDLSLLEEADAYERLMAEYGWTQEELGRRVGKPSSYISSVRKVARADALRQALEAQRISGRVARELAGLFDPRGLTERVPGSVDAMLQWIEVTRPAVAAIAQQVREIVTTGQVPDTLRRLTVPGGRPPVHQSWAERRQREWETKERPRLMSRPLVELQEAEAALRRMADEVRQLIAARLAGHDGREQSPPPS